MAQGLARDLRVRWVLEEAGLPHREHVIGSENQTFRDDRARQPFGRVPTIEAATGALFES